MNQEIIEDNSEGTYVDRDGRFIPKILAEGILKEIEIITCRDNQEVFYFDENEGIWLPNGEIPLKEIAQRKLGIFAKRSYVDEAVSFVKNATLQDRKVFEEGAFLLPLANGIFNINEMSISHYTSTYHFLSKLPITYDPQSTCPRIEKFLSEIISEEDMELLVEVVGYCLWREYQIRKAVMLVGDGDNGKSTFLKLMEKFLGTNNISSVGLTDLENNRFASARLYGKYANIYADLPDQALQQTGRFKMLTGGDNIEAEKKFRDSFNFTNHAKLLFSCNKLPMKNDDTNAFYRRWLIIRFPYSFEGRADKNLIHKLTTPEELSGLLNLVLPRLKRILESGEFSYNKTTDQLREEYVRLSDSIGAFTMDMLEAAPEDFIEKEKLYGTFTEYCRERRYIVVSKDRFFKALHHHVKVEDFRPEIDGRRVQCLKGIRVKGVNSVNPNSHLNPLEDSHTLLKYTNQSDTSDRSDIDTLTHNKEL